MNYLLHDPWTDLLVALQQSLALQTELRLYPEFHWDVLVRQDCS